jgi:hypothetical protein
VDLLKKSTIKTAYSKDQCYTEISDLFEPVYRFSKPFLIGQINKDRFQGYSRWNTGTTLSGTLEAVDNGTLIHLRISESMVNYGKIADVFGLMGLIVFVIFIIVNPGIPWYFLVLHLLLLAVVWIAFKISALISARKSSYMTVIIETICKKVSGNVIN